MSVTHILADLRQRNITVRTQGNDLCVIADKGALSPELWALLASHKPLGAYEIMDCVGPNGSRPAPITIYRALDFLREQGFVHRIESRNAFVACVHTHANTACGFWPSLNLPRLPM